MAIVKAEAVFNAGSGFTEDELARIRAAAGRRTISFCEPSPRQAKDNVERMMAEYGKGKSAEDAGKQFGYSRRAVFYYLNRERARGMRPERVSHWQTQGLGLRQVGRIYGLSHETIRKMGQEEVEVEVEVESGGGG